MNYKPIIIVSGEPNSIFLEIFFKSIKKKFLCPIILIASYKLVVLQMKKLKYKKKITLLEFDKLSKYKLDNKGINLINVNYKFSNPFESISTKSNNYIKQCFAMAFKIINEGISNKLINGPISKKYFLKKKYLGMTEYIASKYSINKKAMLIYNKHLSVCPLTTHLPLKLVSQEINQKNIIEKIELLNSFYKNNLNIKPKIGVLVLNFFLRLSIFFQKFNCLYKAQGVRYIFTNHPLIWSMIWRYSQKRQTKSNINCIILIQSFNRS